MSNLCTQCGHPEEDHGPASGWWKNETTGEWTDVLPGRPCYYMENQGYSQDLCCCTGFNEKPEDVLIAIGSDFSHVEQISAFLAFFPKPRSRAAPKVGNPAGDGLAKRFFVHVGKHQDIA